MGHSQGVLEVLINFHDGGLVTAPVAVVGGAEDGDNVSLVAPVVTLHHELVRPRHEGQAVAVVEGLRDVRAKGVPGTSWGDAPAGPVIRVRPEEVAHRTLVGNLDDSVQRANVIQRVDGGGETSMETENLRWEGGCVWGRVRNGRRKK